MKKGVRIINCARGGLVDENALRAALDFRPRGRCCHGRFCRRTCHRQCAVWSAEPCCTPHLGAATTEAQENVALQVAEQMADYLTTGAVTNALNSPSISAEEAPRLAPFVKLAELVGSFAGQLTETAIEGITIEYAGDIAELNTQALSFGCAGWRSASAAFHRQRGFGPSDGQRARHRAGRNQAWSGGRL